jgi:hypothetical protein
VQDKLKISMANSDKLGKRVVESEQARTLMEGKLVAAERKAAILQQKLAQGQGGQVGCSRWRRLSPMRTRACGG